MADSPESLFTYRKPDFDNIGFWAPDDPTALVKWEDVIRVGRCYRMHSFVIADWDYWAFQTNDSSRLIWIEIPQGEGTDLFSDEVVRRFGKVDLPPTKEWHGNTDSFAHIVCWPQQDL